MNLIKLKLKELPLYHYYREMTLKREYSRWEKNSNRQGILPHIAKREVLKSYAKEYNLKILVETGTFYGDMIYGLRDYFEEIYSIELDKRLYRIAIKRFKKNKNINLINGDSSIELMKLVKNINQPTLFWLDAHYSGGETAKGEKLSPILRELDIITKYFNNKYIIIIDDARCFGKEKDYPTIEELIDFANTRIVNLKVEIKNDMIFLLPEK